MREKAGVFALLLFAHIHLAAMETGGGLRAGPGSIQEGGTAFPAINVFLYMESTYADFEGLFGLSFDPYNMRFPKYYFSLLGQGHISIETDAETMFTFEGAVFYIEGDDEVLPDDYQTSLKKRRITLEPRIKLTQPLNMATVFLGLKLPVVIDMGSENANDGEFEITGELSAGLSMENGVGFEMYPIFHFYPADKFLFPENDLDSSNDIYYEWGVYPAVEPELINGFGARVSWDSLDLTETPMNASISMEAIPALDRLVFTPRFYMKPFPHFSLTLLTRLYTPARAALRIEPEIELRWSFQI